MNRSSFDEFLTVVTNRVWEYLSECFSDASFELSTVAKNNGYEEFYKAKAFLFTETQVELVDEPDTANEVQN